MCPASWKTAVTPGSQLDRRGVVHRLEQPDGLAGVVLGVERLDAPAPGPAGLAGAPLGFHLLDVGGVEQHDLRQVARGRRGVDGTGEALPAPAAGSLPEWSMWAWVSRTKAISAGIEGEGREVERLLLVAPLMHAAVHQEAGLPDLHHVAGPGDFARRPADL